MRSVRPMRSVGFVEPIYVINNRRNRDFCYKWKLFSGHVIRFGGFYYRGGFMIPYESIIVGFTSTAILAIVVAWRIIRKRDTNS